MASSILGKRKYQTAMGYDNDYHIIAHKHYIDKIMLENNFYRDYVEGGGWGPCKNYFFEVWKKNI